MTSVSVVMGTYNGAAFAEEQLRCILDQTVRPTEVLVSDDGSTDGTLEVVSRVAADSSIPVHIHRNDRRLGFADNFLAAAARCRGEFIAFSDQDDRWDLRKLEAGWRGLVRHDAVLSTHRVAKIDQNGREVSDRKGRMLPSVRRLNTGPTLIEANRANPWGNFYGFTMLFRSSLLEKLPADARGSDVHSLDAPLSHDRWVYFLATTFGRTVVLDEVLAHYRQHSGQLYGGEVGRSLTERLRTKLATGRSQSLKLGDVADHRADLLERHAPTALGLVAARRWRQLASYLRNSAALHDDEKTLRQHLSLLASAVRRGDYRSLEQGGLGGERLAEDSLIVAARTAPWCRKNRDA